MVELPKYNLPRVARLSGVAKSNKANTQAIGGMRWYAMARRRAERIAAVPTRAADGTKKVRLAATESANTKPAPESRAREGCSPFLNSSNQTNPSIQSASANP